MSTATKQIEELANTEYKYGFATDVEQDIIPIGLDEDVVRLISSKKGEPEWLLDWRLKAFRAWLKMTEPHWQNVTYAPIDYQGVSYYAAPSEKKKLNSLDEVDPEIRATFNKLGIPIEEQKLLVERRRRRGVRFGVGGHDVPQQAGGARHHLLLVLRSGEGPSRPGQGVPRLGRAAHRQLFCRAQLGGVQRRQLRLHPEGHALPDGAVDLFPHQRQEHRPVRAHADHRRRGRVCQLPRRLHGADARRKPAARGGGRARRAQGRHHQVLDGPELVPGRQERQGRHLQLRHQARHLQGRPLEDHVDAGRDRLGGDVEVPELHPAGRRLGRRVLLGGRDQQLPAGRHRHQDDPPREEHPQHDRVEGHLGRQRPEHLSRRGEDRQEGGQRAQLLAVRLAADRRPLRRPYVPVSRNQEHHRARSSTKRRPRRSAKTRCSTASSAASRRKTRST